MKSGDILRKIRQTIMMVCIALGAIALIMGSLPSYVSIVLFSIALIILIWNSIGTYFYAKAIKGIQSKDEGEIDKSIPYFTKAIKWGINEKGQNVCGTLLLQRGDMELGREILENRASGKDLKTRDAAKVSLSMYWWAKGNVDKAIELCLDAHNNGFRDKNLYINLCTYFLEKEDFKSYRKYIKECNDNSLASPAILDLETSYFMIQGDWKKAGINLKALFDKTSPSYVDPYVHQAILLLHYGEWESAIKSLNTIFDTCSETNTSLYTFGEIRALIEYIEDEDTRWGLLEVVNNEPILFVKGKMPEVKRGLKKPETPSLPSFVSESFDPSSSSLDGDEDEGDVNTSLTDEDEEWIKRHEGN